MVQKETDEKFIKKTGQNIEKKKSMVPRKSPKEKGDGCVHHSVIDGIECGVQTEGDRRIFT